jgi:hypothetical protein
MKNIQLESGPTSSPQPFGGICVKLISCFLLTWPGRAARYQQELRQGLEIDDIHEGSNEAPVFGKSGRKTSGASSPPERYAPSKESQKDFKQIFMSKWRMSDT